MLVLKLLSRLPLSILYGISDFVFIVGYHVIRYRRKVVWNNLLKSFPSRPTNELRQIERKFYRNMCDYVVETLKLLTIPLEELRLRMVFKNPEVSQRFTNSNQSTIMFASHQFNWEWLLAVGPSYLQTEIDFVYQAQSSEIFNSFVMYCRTRFGQYPIQREKVAREMAKRRHITRAVAIVADQFPGLGSDKRYWTQFLNQETAFFQAINQMPLLTQYPSFYASVTKLKRGYYEVELIAISEPPYNKVSFHVADDYARALEQAIARNPDNWLWSHKRWKIARPSGE